MRTTKEEKLKNLLKTKPKGGTPLNIGTLDYRIGEFVFKDKVSSIEELEWILSHQNPTFLAKMKKQLEDRFVILGIGRTIKVKERK